MERNTAVVIDSNVIYPASLRDLLVTIAALAQPAHMFRAKWTAEIHDEWIRNVLINEPHLKKTDLERTRTLMDAAVEDCLVTGFQHRINSLDLPDPDDRHVLAAAIESGATIIVTSNLKDFPDAKLKASRVLAKHPDDFIMDFLETYEEQGEALLEEAVRAIKNRLKNPPKTWTEYFDTLEQVGLKLTVERLKELIPASEVARDEVRSSDGAESRRELQE